MTEKSKTLTPQEVCELANEFLMKCLDGGAWVDISIKREIKEMPDPDYPGWKRTEPTGEIDIHIRVW